ARRAHSRGAREAGGREGGSRAAARRGIELLPGPPAWCRRTRESRNVRRAPIRKKSGGFRALTPRHAADTNRALLRQAVSFPVGTAARTPRPKKLRRSF